MISFLLGKSVGVTRVLRVRLSTASSAAERSEQELIGLTVALTKLSYKANSTVSGISDFSEIRNSELPGTDSTRNLRTI